MIIDHLSNAAAHTRLHPAFAAAFRFLARPDLAQLPAGRVEIDGERMYANVDDAEGRGEEGAKLEAHRRYIDIQYVVSGDERMGWRELARCGRPEDAFKPERDIGFYLDRPDVWFDVPPGYFAIFWPDDAHAPLAGRGPVRKIVVKVAV